jgi:hypothetical protein
MFDPGAISLPGVLKNLRKSMIFISNGGHFPFIQIHLNRAVPWKNCLNTKEHRSMWIK